MSLGNDSRENYDTPRMVADYRQYRRRRARWYELQPTWLTVLVVGIAALVIGYGWAWDAADNRIEMGYVVPEGEK